MNTIKTRHEIWKEHNASSYMGVDCFCVEYKNGDEQFIPLEEHKKVEKQRAAMVLQVRELKDKHRQALEEIKKQLIEEFQKSHSDIPTFRRIGSIIDKYLEGDKP